MSGSNMSDKGCCLPALRVPKCKSTCAARLCMIMTTLQLIRSLTYYFVDLMHIPNMFSHTYYKMNFLNHSHSRVPLENIVCHFHTFENNLGIKQKFTKYLKESCCLSSG